MKKLLLILLIGMFLVNLGSAQQTLGTFQQGSNINLVQSCQNSTYSNLTRVIDPDGAFIIRSSLPMTKEGNDYNYSFSNTSQLGEYLVYGNCNEDGIETPWVYNFFITPSGAERINSGEGISLIIALGSMLLIGSILLFVGFKVSNPLGRFSAISGGIIVYVMVILYTTIVIQQNFGEMQSIITGYETFWFVIKMLLSVGLLAFFIITFAIMFKYWKLKRGLIDTFQ